MSNENGNNLLVQGRIVWGMGSNLFEGKQKTDYNTNAPIIGNDGQPVKEYGFGLAIPKIDPATGQQSAQFAKVWAALHQEAYTLYPNGSLPPGFAMKFKDGDGIDHNGKNFADREGHAGHIILCATTMLPIKWFVFEGGNNILVNTGIKCGDYVEVQLNLKAHPAKGQGKPGLYLNPSAVRLIQPGAEIVNAPNGDQIFGAVAPPVYAGAVAPVANAMPGQVPPTPDMAAAMGAPANHALPPGQVPPAPQAPAAAPHYDVLPPGQQPAAPQAPAQPAYAPPQPQAPAAAPVMPGMPAPPIPGQ